LPNLGNDIWTAIGNLQVDAEDKRDALASRMTRINEDLSLFKAGDDYWKAILKDWANQQELRQLQIREEFGELRQETHQQTDKNHKRLAEQMRAEMKAQVEKMRRQQDAIMKKI
jgi:hypothetical protein